MLLLLEATLLFILDGKQITILWALGVGALIVSFWTLPSQAADFSVSLSPKAYLPLLRSQKAWFFMGALCFFLSCLLVFYWDFTAFIHGRPRSFFKKIRVLSGNDILCLWNHLI